MIAATLTFVFCVVVTIVFSLSKKSEEKITKNKKGE